MSRTTFERLCQMLAPYLVRERNFERVLTVEKCVAIAIYRLSTNCDLRSIGNAFGVARSTVCVIVHLVCHHLCTHFRDQFIVWPTGNKLDETVNGFLRLYGFPQCAGAIDGSHIQILAPHQYHTDYSNRKGWHSIVLQAVADHNLRFTDVFVGWPGRAHDARILRNSA
ncbi:protein ANTAGONIST OF LIKE HETEROCHROMATIN PROTEIN 1-like [Anneissia japonica]|uniref:protein ANTAGONIST OF LIKE HETEROCHROMATIN PROTEIN 1-like n=1 Tax=Anneissia japonica TaxID=1529436 RepID=UPI0014254B15|nr:protein ANTAGONIST OF LIKE HETEROCHROMATIN PROTEIN 1-like [Anneissia japonica]